MSAYTLPDGRQITSALSIKFDSKVLADVAEALEPHTTNMFKNRHGRWMAVVELAHVERTEPGPDEDKAPAVKVRVVGIEVAPCRQKQTTCLRRCRGGANSR